MADLKVKVGVVVENGDKTLLIREWSNKKSGYFWNIIKGTYGDKENESLFECAIRECIEEAGVKVQLTSLLDCGIKSNKEFVIQFNFIAKFISQDRLLLEKARQIERGEDIQEIRWFTVEEIKLIPEDLFINDQVLRVLKQRDAGMHYPLEIIKTV